MDDSAVSEAVGEWFPWLSFLHTGERVLRPVGK